VLKCLEMKYDPKEIKIVFESLTPVAIQEINEKDQAEHVRQKDAFIEGYKRGVCYLCGKPFKTITHSEPCLHWLLRRCKFKKKDFPNIFKKYSYHNMAAFLRWCANQEQFLSNINDLDEEKPQKKILCYSIKWKNIKWTFDCSSNDYSGHSGSQVDFPHYHFQMQIDGQPFISFSDFHVPFTNDDLFTLSLSSEDWYHHDFGSIGSGMQDAVSVSMDKVLEHATTTEDESEATYHFSTIIDASENPLSGEEIYEIQQEAIRTGKSFALIAQQRLHGRATVKTVVRPADSIPDIARRTERKR